MAMHGIGKVRFGACRPESLAVDAGRGTLLRPGGRYNRSANRCLAVNWLWTTEAMLHQILPALVEIERTQIYPVDDTVVEPAAIVLQLVLHPAGSTSAGNQGFSPKCGIKSIDSGRNGPFFAQI